MNARDYRVSLNHTPLDFPAIMGLGKSSLTYRTDPPHIINNKVELTITKAYTLHDMYNNKDYVVLAVQSVYQIPPYEIKSREDVHEFFKDATLGLNEVYQSAQADLPSLHKIVFDTPPIENYKQEIDGVLYILESQN